MEKVKISPHEVLRIREVQDAHGVSIDSDKATEMKEKYGDEALQDILKNAHVYVSITGLPDYVEVEVYEDNAPQTVEEFKEFAEWLNKQYTNAVELESASGGYSYYEGQMDILDYVTSTLENWRKRHGNS